MVNDLQKVRLVRFAVTGLGATLIHIVAASVLIEQQQVKPNMANGCAFIMATLFSYLVNTYWSFSSVMNAKNVTRFWITSIVGLVLAVALSSLADLLSFHYLVGIAMVVITVPIISFLIHSNWTFRQ